ALTAVFIALSSKKIFRSAIVGVLSGFFIATNFTHIRCSHFITTDVPATFFISLVLWATTKMDNENRWHIWAGIFSGLAAATKYNAGLSILIPISYVAYQSNARGFFKKAVILWKDRRMRWIVRSAAISFIAASPYVLLTPARFVKNFGFEAYHMKTGHLGFENAGIGYLYHLKISFPQAMGIVMFAFSIFGLVLLMKRKKIYLWIFPVAYYAIIGSWKVMFQRYTVPLYPFFAIFCAFFVFWLSSKVKFYRNFVVIILFVVSIAFPLTKSVIYDVHLLKKTTYELLGEWVSDNVSPDECICSDFIPNKGFVIWSDDLLAVLKNRVSRKSFWAKSTDPLLNRCWIFIDENSCLQKLSDLNCEYFIECERLSHRYLNAKWKYQLMAGFYEKLHRTKPIARIDGEFNDWWERYSLQDFMKSEYVGATYLIYRIK
ncbi:glycosyltransferase family 39 protein, partial [bacterium]|nr:glycosyltransferase family 39 protein [bacterium]